MNDWISLKDKLPTKKLVVIFATNDNKIWVGNMSCKIDSNNWLWVSVVPYARQIISKIITHWMLLPRHPDHE